MTLRVALQAAFHFVDVYGHAARAQKRELAIRQGELPIADQRDAARAVPGQQRERQLQRAIGVRIAAIHFGLQGRKRAARRQRQFHHGVFPKGDHARALLLRRVGQRFPHRAFGGLAAFAHGIGNVHQQPGVGCAARHGQGWAGQREHGEQDYEQPRPRRDGAPDPPASIARVDPEYERRAHGQQQQRPWAQKLNSHGDSPTIPA